MIKIENIKISNIRKKFSDQKKILKRHRVQNVLLNFIVNLILLVEIFFYGNLS